MDNIVPIKKQKLSMKQKYSLYLSEGPKSKDKLSNEYNLFDDLNSNDSAMTENVRNYLLIVKNEDKAGVKSEEIIKENNMSKDRGRKAIKKPKQVKAKA